MSSAAQDRTVHAVMASSAVTTEVAHYGRAGKWYLEVVGGRRQAVSLTEAVAAVKAEADGAAGRVTWLPGLTGGAQFDARVRTFWPARAE